MKRVELVTPAAFELADAVHAYDQTQPGLGDELLRHVDRAITLIASHPAAAASVSGTFRRAVVSRFPFCLVYYELEDRIQILALFPTRADPERLIERLRPASQT